MLKVDMNSDLGESFGAYHLGMDAEILSYVTSANVACGMHAGDPVVMMQTVELAKSAHVAVGAHPGYPDLQGFGRRSMALSPAEAKAYTVYQMGALTAFLKAQGMTLQHVKLHGALYNNAAVDEKLALAICEGIQAVQPDIILLGLANSRMIDAARKVGLRAASEVFADRAYNDDGTLVSRKLPGAVLHDADLAIARTVRMVREGVVETISGKVIPIQADSICVHGDNASALEFVSRIRKALQDEGVSIVPLKEVV